MKGKQRYVTVHDLLTPKEQKSLKRYVVDNKGPQVHNLVMKWLDDNHQVTERMHDLEIIKVYGAYLLEYMLNLSDL